MQYISDVYDQWKQHDQEQADALDALPVCCKCGEHIQDEFCYFIDGDCICESCIDNYKVHVEDLNF